MKLRKLFFLLLSVALVGGFASCSDDDDSDDGKKDVIKLLTEIDISTEEYDEFSRFEYDSQNRLVKLTVKDVDKAYDYETSYTTEFTYGNDGKLEKVEKKYLDESGSEDRVFYEQFTYNRDSVFVESGRLYSGVPSSSLPENDTLILNSKGSLSKRIIEGSLEAFKYDDNDNLIELLYSYKGVETGKSTYEYGKYKSILSNQNTPMWYWQYAGDYRMYTGKNDCVKSTYEEEYKGELYSSTKEWTNIVDEDGYPTGFLRDGKEYNNVFKYKIIE